MKPQIPVTFIFPLLFIFSCSPPHRGGLFSDNKRECPYIQYMYNWTADSTVLDNSSYLELSAGIATMAQTLSKIILRKDSAALSGLSASYKKDKVEKHYETKRITFEQYNTAADQTRRLCNIWTTLQNNLYVDEAQRSKYLKMLEEIQTSNSNTGKSVTTVNQSNVFGNNNVYSPTYNIDPALVIPTAEDVKISVDTSSKKITIAVLKGQFNSMYFAVPKSSKLGKRPVVGSHMTMIFTPENPCIMQTADGVYNNHELKLHDTMWAGILIQYPINIYSPLVLNYKYLPPYVLIGERNLPQSTLYLPLSNTLGGQYTISDW